MHALKKSQFTGRLTSLKIEQYTTPAPVTLSPDKTVADIQKVFLENGFRHIPVVENNRVVGIISHRDYTREVLRNNSFDLKVSQIMTQSPYMVHYNESMETVCFYMSDEKIGSAIVVDDDQQLVGIFTTTDALNALVDIIRGDIE